jgi:hypothetical protein
MKLTRFWCLIGMLIAAPATWAQTTDDAPAAPVPPKEDAQAKVMREQSEGLAAARKAEADAAIAADIARHPDGANAVAAKKASEDAAAVAAAKQIVETKAKTDAEADAKVAADKDEKDRKAAAVAWAAGAAERDRATAAKNAAVDKWRATAKPAPSIMMSRRGDGTFVVMVDGKISKFATEAEAQAFADKIRNDADPALSY